jgi:hypothetical protein
VLPYLSIYAVTSHVTGEALVWPEDLPAEVIAGAESALEPRAQPLAEVLAEPAAATGGSASSIESGESGEAEEKTPASAVARPRSHLRLIK